MVDAIFLQQLFAFVFVVAIVLLVGFAGKGRGGVDPLKSARLEVFKGGKSYVGQGAFAGIVDAQDGKVVFAGGYFEGILVVVVNLVTYELANDAKYVAAAFLGRDEFLDFIAKHHHANFVVVVYR